MKSGTSFHDRNDIRDYVNAGQTNARYISERLNIKESVVQGVVDSLLTRGQKAAATRAANKAKEEAA